MYLVVRVIITMIGCKTPKEMWLGNLADYSNLSVFGSPAYDHVKINKLELRVVKCILMEYTSGVKEYRLWCTNQDSP